MKKWKAIPLFLLTTGLGAMEAHSQSLVVQTTDGAESSVTLATLHGFTLPDGNIILKDSSAVTTSFNLSNINKLYFKNVDVFLPLVLAAEAAEEATWTQTASSLVKQDKLAVYPNPASSYIRVGSTTATTFIDIYRIDGARIKRIPVSESSTTIDISDLPRGLYLLYANGKTTKFNKI